MKKLEILTCKFPWYLTLFLPKYCFKKGKEISDLLNENNFKHYCI